MLKPLSVNTGQVILVFVKLAPKTQRNGSKLETIDNKLYRASRNELKEFSKEKEQKILEKG